MGVIVGLDIGGSTTKIVGLEAGVLVGSLFVKAGDPVASAYGALGRFISDYAFNLDQIDRIMVTGVGESSLKEPLFGIPTHRVPEMQCVGFGGLYLAGLDEAIVCSLGTGTSLVRASHRETRRLIGSGVGGGTVLGLARALTGTRDFEKFEELAERGDLTQVDLSIGDISRSEVAGLGSDITASNFGKVDSNVEPEDLAAGVMNMVFQSIGTLAIMTGRAEGLKHVVFTGTLTYSKMGITVLDGVAELYKMSFIVPDKAEYATAIGAALSLPSGQDRQINEAERK